MGDHHLHRLKLLVLRRDGAHLVGDLIACHRNVLSFDAVERKLQLIINDKHSYSLAAYLNFYHNDYLRCSRYFRVFFIEPIIYQSLRWILVVLHQNPMKTLQTPPPS